MHPRTRLALAGQQTDSAYNSIVPPLYQSAIFRFEDLGVTKGFDYTRSGNPTRDALADALTELEGGVGAVVTSTGMAAIGLVCQLLRPGELLIAPHDCYGGTFRLFSALAGDGSKKRTATR